MKNCLLVLCVIVCFSSFAQTPKLRIAFKLDKNTIVKDSTGLIYSYQDWKTMQQTGEFGMRPISPDDENSEFLIYRFSAAELQYNKQRLDQYKEIKPKESTYFSTGSDFDFFSARDLDGSKFNKNSLKGKILVVNFWFINCPPCNKEIPDLNELTKEYAGNNNVVFLAIALDSQDALNAFLKKTAFSYHIVPSGRDIATKYGIHSYPTNLVVDQQGRVRFHTSGLAPGTVNWIKKTIDGLNAL